MSKAEKLLDWDMQTQYLLKLINIARVTILFSFLIFLIAINSLRVPITHLSFAPLIQNQSWLFVWCGMYSMIILVSLFYPNWALQKKNTLPNISAVVDITMIAVLVFLTGGMRSGFGVLMLPFLATSCLLSYGRFPLIYGSYASLLIVIDAAFAMDLWSTEGIHKNFTLITSQLFSIAVCYLVPLLTSFSAEYLAHVNQRLKKQKTAFDRISGLNDIVLNRVQEGVIVLDRQCKVWLFNQQAQEIIPELKLNEPVADLQSVVDTWSLRPTASCRHNITVHGTQVYVRAIPLVQEETELLMLFIRDQSEREREAQTLKLAALGVLTSNLAHEIRNPLSTIRHASDLLRESDEYQQPQITKLTNMVEKNISRIDKMIEDISALNKRNKADIQDIELKTFWQNFQQEFQLSHPQSAGCLHMEIHPQNLVGRFDPQHLQQILWNLCNNAWRHSKKIRDSVIVRIFVSGKDIVIQVADDGGGVVPELLPHLFEPFQTTHEAGTGLGLYVSRELAHANQGNLQYQPDTKTFELSMKRKKDE